MSIVIEALFNHLVKEVIAKHPGAKPDLNVEGSGLLKMPTLKIKVSGFDIDITVTQDMRVRVDSSRMVGKRDFTPDEQKAMAEKEKAGKEDEWSSSKDHGWQGAMLWEPGCDEFSVPLEDPKSIDKILAEIEEILDAPPVDDNYVMKSLDNFREMMRRACAYHERKESAGAKKLQADIKVATDAKDWDKVKDLTTQYDTLVGDVDTEIPPDTTPPPPPLVPNPSRWIPVQPE